MTSTEGSFLSRGPRVDPLRHYCALPMVGGKSPKPDAGWHDVWECRCGRLWAVYGRGGNHWVRLGRYASWRARRKARTDAG